VIVIDVATGKTLDFSTQVFTSSATAGYIKNGVGVVALAGNTYGGGFTINAGTVVMRGVNGMGGGATNSLTINGGTIAARACY
jgi:autotransporter-associated beta strand protein